ncbi:hypothetical protein QZH41_007231 [Actinostola sp. cb2023]|nr:hypothetical protein QZH41_007231 [Actinostola sp. cb2023]
MKIDDADQFNKLKEVWKTWLRLSIRQENNMSHQRRQIFATDAQAQDGMKSLLNEIPRRHRRSMTDWLSYGVLLAEKKRKKATKENFTLLGSTLYPHNSTGPFVYNIESDCLPFNCWDYKDASAGYPELNDVTEMYNRYITDVLKTCIERLQSDGIHISFILCDCTQVTNYIPDTMKFDRITTSNLWDYIALPRLFTLLKPLLNPHNQSAAIVTESHNWPRQFPFLDLPTIGMIDELSRRKIFQDTGNKNIAESHCVNSFKDYCSITEEVTCFARASLLDDSKKSTSLIPSLDQLAAKFGLRPRDFICHGNKISPFRWQLNCRRITMIRGTELSVEWVLV